MRKRVNNLLYRFQPVYNRWIRPHLPRTTRLYNSVEVKNKALLDRTPSFPDFEYESIKQLRDAITPGDTVVIVGGGHGVTAVHAAWAGASEVRVLEAAEKQVKLIEDTAKRNDAEDRIAVEHSLVGDGINVWGSADSARQVPPAELPPCDVLELDCEGAELRICDELGPRPNSIIIECHPHYDAPASKVREALPAGYEIVTSTIDQYDGLPVIRADKDDQ